MRFGIVVFPGTWSDGDCYYQVRDVLGQEAVYVWHQETSLAGVDCAILPGGFSYGDYLRAGALARFSPVMGAIQAHVDAGGLAVGICNGFQVLCEAGLLPGALMRNSHLEYRCQWTYLRTERNDTAVFEEVPAWPIVANPRISWRGQLLCRPRYPGPAGRQRTGAFPLL